MRQTIVIDGSSRPIDALEELVDVGLSQAAGTLAKTLHTKVRLQAPCVELLSWPELRQEIEHPGEDQLVSVQFGFQGPFRGASALVLPTADASKLVATLTGYETHSFDLDWIRIGTLTEVGNIVLNGVMGAIGGVLNRRLSYSIPTCTEFMADNTLTRHNGNPEAMGLLAPTRFMTEQLEIEGQIILISEVGWFDTLVTAIDTH